MLRSALSLSLMLLTCGSVAADHWPGWRGPQGNGVAEGEGGAFPTEWSGQENVAWKIALPGRAGSTPAIWGDRIFLTLPLEGKNGTLCLDRDGKELWRQTTGDERPGKHKKGSGANPSPVTDGTHVYVYFKSGDLACLDLQGKIVWQKNLQDLYGEDSLWWDLGTSPVLTQRHVVVAVMQTGPSYLVAFDRQTGEVAWKQDRNLEAPEEAAQSYSTPVVYEEGGEQRMAVLGADHVTGHDAATGKELWRVGGLNPEQDKYFRSIASPAVADGVIVAPYARGRTLTAIRAGGSGDVTQSHVLWSKSGVSSDVPTPIAVDGRIYSCTDKGKVICLELETGEVLWEGDLPKGRAAYSSSPVLANGRLYLTREDATTFVLAAGDAFQLVAENALGERPDDEYIVATPAFVDGRIYLRTFDHLYCIGK